MPVRARIILRPHRVPLAPVAAAAPEPESAAAPLRIHQPRERPLGLFLIIGWTREIIVFEAGVLPERPLKSEERRDGEKPQPGAPQYLPHSICGYKIIRRVREHAGAAHPRPAPKRS